MAFSKKFDKKSNFLCSGPKNWKKSFLLGTAPPQGLPIISYRVAIKGQSYVAAGFSLRLHRLESLCHHLTATWYQKIFIPTSKQKEIGKGGNLDPWRRANTELRS
jgi:hypothetical protein